MKKKLIIIGLAFIVCLISASFVSADFWACFNRGEEIDFCSPKIPDRTSPSNGYQLCMENYDSARECYSSGSWNVCNYEGGECVWNGNYTLDQTSPELIIIAPLNNSVINARKALVRFNLSEKSDVYYTDLVSGRGRWTKICEDCTAYSGTRSFKEGENNIQFKAVDVAGNEAYKEVTFFIDSKKPDIKKTEPKKDFANGIFYVSFKEENPKELFLTYGNNAKGYDYAKVDLNECTEETNGKKYCEINADLTAYNGQLIEYWFNLTDIAGNYDESKKIILRIDKTAPKINSINYTIDERAVKFRINITELNFDKVEYIDNSAVNPRWRTMCSRLTDGICEKKITLNSGAHNIGIQAIDEAGNIAGKNVAINIA
ncbi:MAG: hypothetical protein WC533_01150 [Candidatus Pacearchaeota archaeon]